MRKWFYIVPMFILFVNFFFNLEPANCSLSVLLGRSRTCRCRHKLLNIIMIINL